MSPDASETCWTVLRAAAAGDEAARSTFALFYAATIRNYLAARWRGRHHIADLDDASQEVFVECLKPDGVLQRADASRGDFRGLLFGVARNVACRFEKRALERGRLRPEDSAWLEQVIADDAGQATMFDRSWPAPWSFRPSIGTASWPPPTGRRATDASTCSSDGSAATR